MFGFLIFVGVITALVLFVRTLRRREIEAFKDAGASTFESLTGQPFIENSPVSNLKSASEKPASAPEPAAMAAKQPISYSLKARVFDDIHRNFYLNLEQVVGQQYRIFREVALSEFISTNAKSAGLLQNKVSFLICDELSVYCAIQLRRAGPAASAQFAAVQEIFASIDIPLLDFPLVSHLSEQEIREQFNGLSLPESRNCPKCGEQMLVRKAVKGKNAGKQYWVCTKFPSCNGIARIGQFS